MVSICGGAHMPTNSKWFKGVNPSQSFSNIQNISHLLILSRSKPQQPPTSLIFAAGAALRAVHRWDVVLVGLVGCVLWCHLKGWSSLTMSSPGAQFKIRCQESSERWLLCLKSPTIKKTGSDLSWWSASHLASASQSSLALLGWQ